jgi:hypothetical protein
VTRGPVGWFARASATDACQHGFVPIVIREAVGDRHERVSGSRRVGACQSFRSAGQEDEGDDNDEDDDEDDDDDDDDDDDAKDDDDGASPQVHEANLFDLQAKYAEVSRSAIHRTKVTYWGRTC